MPVFMRGDAANAHTSLLNLFYSPDFTSRAVQYTWGYYYVNMAFVSLHKDSFYEDYTMSCCQIFSHSYNIHILRFSILPFLKLNRSIGTHCVLWVTYNSLMTFSSTSKTCLAKLPCRQPTPSTRDHQYHVHALIDINDGEYNIQINSLQSNDRNIFHDQDCLKKNVIFTQACFFNQMSSVIIGTLPDGRKILFWN